MSKLREIVKDRESWCAAVPRGCKEWDMTERLNNSKSSRKLELTSVNINRLQPALSSQPDLLLKLHTG